jgi:hypothetical protein
MRENRKGEEGEKGIEQGISSLRSPRATSFTFQRLEPTKTLKNF